MGRQERIDTASGLPMRWLSIPHHAGDERGFWIYDASDPAVAAWVRSGIAPVERASDDVLSFAEAAQYWPDDLD